MLIHLNRRPYSGPPRLRVTVSSSRKTCRLGGRGALCRGPVPRHMWVRHGHSHKLDLVVCGVPRLTFGFTVVISTFAWSLAADRHHRILNLNSSKVFCMFWSWVFKDRCVVSETNEISAENYLSNGGLVIHILVLLLFHKYLTMSKNKYECIHLSRVSTSSIMTPWHVADRWNPWYMVPPMPHQ